MGMIRWMYGVSLKEGQPSIEMPRGNWGYNENVQTEVAW